MKLASFKNLLDKKPWLMYFPWLWVQAMKFKSQGSANDYFSSQLFITESILCNTANPESGGFRNGISFLILAIPFTCPLIASKSARWHSPQVGDLHPQYRSGTFLEHSFFWNSHHFCIHGWMGIWSKRVTAGKTGGLDKLLCLKFHLLQGRA